MHKRLSLAMLLLSASICGMEKSGEKQGYMVLAGLKALVRAVTSAASTDTQSKADQLTEVQSNESEPSREERNRSRSSSGSQAGCLSPITPCDLYASREPEKAVPFPSERGECLEPCYPTQPRNCLYY